MSGYAARNRRRTRRGDRSVEKRYLLTQAEDRELEDFLYEIKRKTNVSFAASHFVRAALLLAKVRKDELIGLILEERLPSRPANGDEEATKNFERALARLMVKAIVE